MYVFSIEFLLLINIGIVIDCFVMFWGLCIGEVGSFIFVWKLESASDVGFWIMLIDFVMDERFVLLVLMVIILLFVNIELEIVSEMLY